MEVQNVSSGTATPKASTSTANSDTAEVKSGGTSGLKSSLELQKLALKLIKSSGINVDTTA
ncbi:MAG: hypothetical protein ABEK50_16090 [bacterium]